MSDLRSFHGPNAGYLADLYDRFLQEPTGFDPEVRKLLASFGASLNGAAPPAPAEDAINQAIAAVHLAQAIRARGHLAAQLDPLGSAPPGDPGLDAARRGIDDAVLKGLPASVVGGRFGQTARNAAEAIAELKAIYCSTTGYDFDHVHSPEERAWLRDAVEWRRYEVPDHPEIGEALLRRLTDVETFERFLHRTFPGQKRFSIEGLDVLVPMIDEIVARTAEAGGQEVVIGMAHRGRLNVMVHVLGKPYEQIFARFHDPSHRDHVPASGFADKGYAGDVKYHLGVRSEYHGGVVDVQLTLAPNPSHLEFVNPVVMGMDRACDDDRTHRGAPVQYERAALAVMIHGDAAFVGQGVVAETLNLSRLPGYNIGGAIHIIANNQIGFTTVPGDARSTLYASDLAKGFEIPVVHVNADDVLACLSVTRLAHAYRSTFGKDFLIDLIGYRRWGHNEGDEPAFTQPRLYAVIEQHPTVRTLWARHLVERGFVSPEHPEKLVADRMSELQAIRASITNGHHSGEEAPPTRVDVHYDDPRLATAVPEAVLLRLNEELSTIPPRFTVNPKLEKVLRRRASDVREGIDWGHAEALAMASILAEGTPIRMSGQDTERGTFSHRHAVLYDAVTGARYVPLQAMPSARASFAIYNSPLSEAAVLGFEYGYSVQAPDALVLWEAQFGDFANGAQVIIDQFVAAARAKWGLNPAVVLLLPHGYEGQGAEHSSARLSRFLELCAEDNLRVVNCTTAGQYFHVLRRQARLLALDPRPLVILTPKSLLRHPRATVRLEALTSGGFQPVIDDRSAERRRDRVTRVVACSGKIYVDLRDSRLDEKATHVAVVRVEELYPIPEAHLAAVFAGYPKMKELVWVQEEPRNMGAWGFLSRTLESLVPSGVRVSCISRPSWAAPAEGDADRHVREQLRLVREAFQVRAPAQTVQGVVHAS